MQIIGFYFFEIKHILNIDRIVRLLCLIRYKVASINKLKKEVVLGLVPVVFPLVGSYRY